MFNRTKISIAAAAVATGLGLCGSAFAQTIQRVEITGSSIKRIDAEGPAPVQIVTRRDIERTGATTLSELVKNIAALDIDDQGELTGNSPSGSGTANLSVRGLSERNVLVLLNGRRLPINALTDGSGAGAAVDVNNIPLSAIERVELLKDGGSAIYGSDAVAGVMNFITKKNFNGFDVRVGYGTSSRSDGTEKSGGVVFGLGDYDASGFNVLAALDVFKRDPIMRADRDITSSADWRRFDGGVDGRSGFHPNGNILNAAGTAVVGQVVPCPAEELRGTTCRFDFNKTVLTAINGADRWSSLLIGSVKLGTVRGFGEFMYSESEDLFEAQPAPGPYVDQQGRTVNGRFMQVGPRTTNREASLLSTTVGLEGSLGNFDWDVAIGQGVSKVTNNDKNYLNDTLFGEALAAGLIDPTKSTNSTTVLDSLRLTPKRDGRSTIKFLNARVSGSLAKLGGGDLGFAVGGTLNKESLRDVPDAQSQAGNVFGSIAQAPVDAKRDLKAVYAELALPFLSNLEAQIAVRYDSYSGASGSIGAQRVNGASASRTSPKVALKYRPFSVLLMRASYAESFLAPSLKQLFGGVDEGAESTSDTDILCPAFGVAAADCDNFPYRNRQGSNPDLKPETGKTINLGFVFEPFADASIGIDLWQIKKDNEVNQPTVETAVENGRFSRIGGQWTVFTNNQNLSLSKSSGADIELRWRANLGFGRLSLGNSLTWYKSIKTQDDPTASVDEFVGTFLSPRWRNTFRASVETGAWEFSTGVRSTAGMTDSDQPAGSAIANAARNISSHHELDLGLRYSGVKSLTLSASVKNALDKEPPFSQRGTQNQYGSLGFPWIYSPRGRYYQVSANYAFK